MSALLTAVGWMTVGMLALVVATTGWTAYHNPTKRDNFYNLALVVLILAVTFLLGLNWTAWTLPSIGQAGGA